MIFAIPCCSSLLPQMRPGFEWYAHIKGDLVAYYRCVCTACASGCDSRAGVWWQCTGRQTSHMVIKVAGKCAQGRHATDGKMLFNALELAVVSKATAGHSHVSVALLREASKKGTSRSAAQASSSWEGWTPQSGMARLIHCLQAGCTVQAQLHPTQQSPKPTSWWCGRRFANALGGVGAQRTFSNWPPQERPILLNQHPAACIVRLPYQRTVCRATVRQQSSHV